MTAQNLQGFATQAARGRGGLWGQPCTYTAPSSSAAPMRIIAAFAAIRTQQDLQKGGWNVEINATIRVLRSITAFVPAYAGVVTLTGTGARYEIAEIQDNPASPEWLIGLVNPQD